MPRKPLQPVKHQKIKEMGLEDKIIELYYNQEMSYAEIAKETGLSKTAVYRFIQDHEIKNYDEASLQKVMQATTNYNPLTIVDMFYRGAMNLSNDMNATELIHSQIRADIMNIVGRKGVIGLVKDSEALVKYKMWQEMSEKMLKQVKESRDTLKAFTDIYTEALNVQKQVSLMRVLLDAMKKFDPVKYKEFMDILEQDEAAMIVLKGLSGEMISEYWFKGETIPAAANRAAKVLDDGTEEKSEDSE